MVHSGAPKAALTDGVRAEHVAHLIEASIGVKRRHHFFVWSQGSLQTLLPHRVIVCGAWHRGQRQLQLEAFNSVLLPPVVLTELCDGQSSLMQHVMASWIANRGQPTLLAVRDFGVRAFAAVRDGLLGVNIEELLVHGVARPQRTSELESLFVLALPGRRFGEPELRVLDAIVPNLHATYLRVQSVEVELSEQAPRPVVVKEAPVRSLITERERQILSWVRDGMSNQQIGVELGISPLTVKNHVQKILRKLGAANRAQAVARAMTMELLRGPARPEPG